MADMRLESAAKEKGCLGVVASVAISIGRVHFMVPHACTQIGGHARSGETERVFHAAPNSILWCGEPLVLAVEPSIHRWRGVLLVGGCHEGKVFERSTITIEVFAQETQRKHSFVQQQVTGGRKAPYLVIEPLSPIVGLVVGSLLAVHPLITSGKDPRGKFATDAQVGSVGHPPFYP